MEYKDFIENLADDLRELFEENRKNIKVEVTEESKPWGKELGISFSKGGSANPILYPQKQYEAFEDGMRYSLMLDEIVNEIEHAFEHAPSRHDIDFETMKNAITMQLVNTEQCRDYVRIKMDKNNQNGGAKHETK